MRIGEAIRKIRKIKGIKQRDLAMMCEISQTYLSQIENNKKTPSIDILDKIGLKLGIPIPVILFLSINEQDIAHEKRDLFNMINPSIEKFISEIFLT